MSVDWSHMFTTVVIILVILQVLERIPGYRHGSKTVRFAVAAVPIFAALLVLNLFWPYGA